MIVAKFKECIDILEYTSFVYLSHAVECASQRVIGLEVHLNWFKSSSFVYAELGAWFSVMRVMMTRERLCSII